MQRSTPIQPTPAHLNQPAVIGGVPVRTNLRAGLAWDDLDDKAKELWSKLTSTVSSATNGITSAISGGANRADNKST